MAAASPLKKLVPFLIILGGGMLVGFAAGYLLKPALAGVPKPPLPLVLGALLFWTVAGIALHELGHVIGGHLAGFRFVLYTVGPFRVAREVGGLRPGLNRSINLAGGVALMVPSTGEATPRALAGFIAGGPLASLLSGLLLMAGAAFLPGRGLGFAFLATGAAMNLGLFVVSAVPSHFGGFDSDGRQLLDLGRGGRLGEVKLLLRSVTTASLLGTRPRGWDRAQIERLVALVEGEPGQLALLAHLVHYYYLLDTGDRAAAGAALARAVAAQGDAHPMLAAPLRLEEAWLAATNGDAPAARAHLDQALRHARFLERHSRARVEAALLRLEGRQAEASATAREGLTHLRRAVDQGGAVMEREWLEQAAGAA